MNLINAFAISIGLLAALATWLCLGTGFGLQVWALFIGWGSFYGAAEWNRRAAELGDRIGMFNHGIDLMRGWGVAENTEAGRQFVGRAVEQGVEIAQRLQGAVYDLNEITPDADNWKFSPLF